MALSSLTKSGRERLYERGVQDAQASPFGASPNTMSDARMLDQWNQQWRASALYQDALRSVGVTPSGPIRLSPRQRDSVKAFLVDHGVRIPEGMVIDPAGNLNQDEGVSRYWNNPAIRYPLLLGGAAATMGAIPGIPGLPIFDGGASSAAGGGAGAIDTSIAGVYGPTSSVPAGAAVPATAGAASAGTATSGLASAARRLIPNTLGELLGLGGTAAALLANRGGSNPFSSDEEKALLEEARRGMALQRQRVEQTQPVFDDLVRRTTSYAPNVNYGGSAYQYQGPRFGG